MALSSNQIAQLWVQEGGNPKYAALMSNIALRESGGRPGINNRGLNKNGTVDWGLYQVNDIWRKDPVIGPLFQSGAILTPQGATQAAIHILKVQGPKAWATYNPAVDAKYIGSGAFAASAARQPVAQQAQQPAAQPAQSVDTGAQLGAQRAALISQYLSNEHDPNAIIGLATGLSSLTPTAAKATKKAARNAPAFDPSAPVGSYMNPHPGNSVVAPGRVDEGTDPTIRAGAPIVAVGNAKVVNVSRNFYKGLPYIVYQLTDGPRAGQYVYVSEYVTSRVRVGQTLRAGQTVALGTGRAIEEGFAGGPRGGYLPLANRAQGGSYTEGAVTGPGIDWAKFSRRLGSSTGRGY